MNITVGIITHDDTTLPRLVEAVLRQEKKDYALKGVIIVSSSILPGNKAALEKTAKENPRVKIISEPKRTGKANAVNTFLKNAKGEVCVLLSGDILIAPDSISELIKPMGDSKVGMVGGRTKPLNDESTFIGFAVHLIWRIHHMLSLIRPKIGEIVAFRNIVKEISPKTAVDEAWIESTICKLGYEIAYSPTAVAYNMGPRNLREYVAQRKRIHMGHVDLKLEQGYVVSSMMYAKVFYALLGCLTYRPKELFWAFVVSLLELYIRLSADVEVLALGRNPACWDIIPSAKFEKS